MERLTQCDNCMDHKETREIIANVRKDVDKNCKVVKTKADKDDLEGLGNRLMTTIKAAILLLIFILGGIGGSYAYINAVQNKIIKHADTNMEWGRGIYYETTNKIYNLQRQVDQHSTILNERYGRLLSGQETILENQRAVMKQVQENRTDIDRHHGRDR